MSTRQKRTLSQNLLEPIVAEAVDQHISQNKNIYKLAGEAGEKEDR